MSQWTKNAVIAFISLIIIQVSLAGAFKIAQNSDKSYPFSPSALLIVSEVIKLVLSAIFYSSSSDNPSFYAACSNLLQSSAAMPIFLLAVLYCANNNLTFLLFQMADGANISLFKVGSTFISAILLRFVLGRSISFNQGSAIVIQVAGLLVVQFASSCEMNTPILQPLAYILLLTSVLITSICGVWNDFIMKSNPDISLHIINAILYLFGFLLNISAFIVFTAQLDVSKLSTVTEGFFHLRSLPVLFFNSIIGISISAVYKYLDASMKTFAAACATSILFLMNILIYGEQFRILILLGCVCVFMSTQIYISSALPILDPTQEAPKSVIATVKKFKCAIPYRVVIFVATTILVSLLAFYQFSIGESSMHFRSKASYFYQNKTYN